MDLAKIIGFILVHGLQIKVGRKVLTNPSIPKFVVNGSAEMQKAFLQQAFDDEGWISFRNIGLSQYSSENNPPIRLLQIKELVEKFSIIVHGPNFVEKCTRKRSYTSYGWEIRIYNQNDLMKFLREIDFSLERKRIKLLSVLDSYILPPRLKNGTVVIHVLNSCEELKEESKEITIDNIANKMKKSRHYISRITKEMVSNNLLKIMKESKGFYPKEFEIM